LAGYRYLANLKTGYRVSGWIFCSEFNGLSKYEINKAARKN
jgi:hypothetical protein